jgi:hypothetical protein
MGQHSTEDVSCNGEVPIEVQADLVEGVANMLVDAKLETGANSHTQKLPEKVSRIDSFMGSSEENGNYAASSGEQMSMHERLLSRGAQVKVLTHRRGIGRGMGGTVKGPMTQAQGSLNDGAETVPAGESTAKRRRLSMVQQNTLTGPHDEAHQVQ